MNITTRLKKVVGAAIAALTLTAIVPAGTAMAAEHIAVDESATSTLTVNGTNSALRGHKFKAIQLASYTDAQVDSGLLATVAIATKNGTTGMKQAMKTAYEAAGGMDSGAHESNIMAAVASSWLGFPLSSSSNADITSNSRGSAWSGQLRNFVTSLVSQQAVKDAISASSYTASGPTFGNDGDPATAQFSGLPIGMYLIVDVTGTPPGSVDSNPAPASIPMLAGTSVKSSTAECTQFSGSDFVTLGSVAMKNDTPTLKKKLVSPTDGSASVGDELEYRITSSVPLTTGFTNYKYIVTDVPGTGLTFVPSSLEINVVETETGNVVKPLAEGTDYLFTAPANPGDNLVFNLSPGIVALNPAHYGQFIRIDYKMKVNENASSTTMGNGVKLEYSNDSSNPPTNNNGDGGTSSTIDHTDEGSKTNVYAYRFQLDVQAKADPSNKLGGAQFNVFAPSDSENPLKFRKLGEGNYKKVDSSTALASDVVVNPQSSNFEGTRGANDMPKGQLRIDGLGSGDYSLKEIAVPTGFASAFASNFTVSFTIDGTHPASAPIYSNSDDAWKLVNSATWQQAQADSHLITVNEVTSFSQLPMTGGAGAILLLLVVLALLLTAGAIYLYTKRREKSLASEL